MLDTCFFVFFVFEKLTLGQKTRVWTRKFASSFLKTTVEQETRAGHVFSTFFFWRKRLSSKNTCLTRFPCSKVIFYMKFLLLNSFSKIMVELTFETFL